LSCQFSCSRSFARFEARIEDTSVSGLWTPSGEHEPSGGGAGGGAGAPGGGPGPGPGTDPGAGEPTPDELEAEMRLAREELSSVPVADIIANHAVGLWQLAVLHLTPDPDADGDSAPHLAEAGLAIDAFAALVEGLGDRLAPHHEAMRDALSQLRLAFVQVSQGE
jgi:hypothetical protein